MVTITISFTPITISFTPTLYVNFVRKNGHTARQCNSAKRLLQQQPEVHHTSFGNSSSSNWIVDSGASHHVTSNLTNLSHHQPYEGPDDILLGDGSSLEITHTGSSKLPTPSKSFCLSNDLKKGARLTQGRSKDDVYEWPWPNKGNTMGATPKQARSMVEKYFKSSLVTLYTDGGTEYKSLKSYFVSQGIQHQVSLPYTPEHVGSVERKHRHVVETGYSNTHNAYKCLDLSSNRVYISHHVQFIEHQFLLASTTSPTDLDQVVSTCSSPSTLTPALLSVCDATPRYDLSSSPLPLSSDSSNTSSPSLSLSPPTQTQGSNPRLEPSHRIVTRSQNNIHCPKQFPGFKTSFHVTKHLLPASLEPTTASQALQDPNWCVAMDDELAALARNHT
ncbi:Retrovirus-related Pol polyprotein from transposon RE2 [Vitis vinifera]|uniref:Retrovirus-related Pol polyprotein from transposon RE2 n=1 Tax=Vitis vinifera TaxID=29760 RepID=A0A438BX08_VITVI|nr:Retrovirus-related Pol polyprotein from transposon RE2 [Vitis vinifera]